MGGRTGLADPATGKPDGRRTNLCCMVPEKPADAISEVLNAKIFLCSALKESAVWQRGVSNCWTETDYGNFVQALNTMF